METLPCARRSRRFERLPHGLACPDRPEADASAAEPELPAAPCDDRLDRGVHGTIPLRHRAVTPTGPAGTGTGSGAGAVAGSGKTSGTGRKTGSISMTRCGSPMFTSFTPSRSDTALTHRCSKVVGTTLKLGQRALPRLGSGGARSYGGGQGVRGMLASVLSPGRRSPDGRLGEPHLRHRGRHLPLLDRPAAAACVTIEGRVR